MPYVVRHGSGYGSVSVYPDQFAVPANQFPGAIWRMECDLTRPERAALARFRLAQYPQAQQVSFDFWSQPDEDPDRDSDSDDDPDPCGCLSCQQDRRSRSRSGSMIRDYMYRPEFQFYGHGPLYLGMELETEVESDDLDNDEVVEQVAPDVGDVGYFKHDGSLDNGFELVTHPMSYVYAMDRFNWDVLPKMRELGCVASSAAGMHVHASRAGFDSQSHVYRWMKMIYRSESQVTRLARRTSTEWAAFDTNERRAGKYYAKMSHPRHGRLSSPGFRDQDEAYHRNVYIEDPMRYSAINVRNRDTFEVRVFRSTLNPRKARAALGLVQATIEYTRQLTAADICQNNGWEWPQFTAWTRDHRSVYPDLVKEMEVR